ncbi:MAG: hypothetical protein JWM78_1574 [Verrucomicrobiaceae bacterium]|nr:hypothetical protein [Verrucomicrobiaceae bacterium]
MRKRIYIFLSLIIFSGWVSAEECEDMLGGSTGASACFAARDAKDTDKQLNESYVLLMKAFIKHNYPKEKLVNAERAWVKYRDQQCELENVTYGGIDSVSWARCMSEITNERLAKINELLGAFDTSGLQKSL